MTARTYRARRVALTDGGSLALRRDGTINQHDPDGAIVGTWAPEDPAWPQRAIRFGIQPGPQTVRPSGRDEPDRTPSA